jgi:sugar O-acyltransferase (sialic acid O-acetyltransferase NeuD family)
MNKMNNSICLIGAGGHGAVIKEILDENSSNIVCFIDANFSINECLGVNVIHEETELNDIDAVSFVISVGSNQSRKTIANQHPRQYINAIHPSSVISKSLTIGVGNAVMAGVCINARTKLGNHCIVNTNATVDHDCVLEDFVHISPGAQLGGNVYVGEGAHIGIGASIKPGVKIGKWSVVGAGAVVVNDVPDGVTVVGIPAKNIK